MTSGIDIHSRSSTSARSARRFGRSATDTDAALPKVAVAWVLSHRVVAGAIVGIRSPQEAEQLVGAANLELSQEELQEIESA
jgi:aryl-alcohol dehydrogenase-like predicted oxidoreductase